LTSTYSPTTTSPHPLGVHTILPDGDEKKRKYKGPEDTRAGRTNAFLGLGKQLTKLQFVIEQKENYVEERLTDILMSGGN
jgi:hypothetical protein